MAAVILPRAAEHHLDEDLARALSEVSMALGLTDIEPLTRMSLSNLRGLLMQGGGSISAAERDFASSLGLARRLFEQLGTPASARDLSIALNNIGRVRVAAGDGAGAEGVYGESLTLRRRLFEQLGTPESARDLSVSLLSLAKQVAHDSPARAKALLLDAESLAQGLPDLDLVTGIQDALRPMVAWAPGVMEAEPSLPAEARRGVAGLSPGSPAGTAHDLGGDAPHERPGDQSATEADLHQRVEGAR